MEEIISGLQAGAGRSKPGSPGITEESKAGSILSCKGVKRDGGNCKLRALADGYCFAHSPALAGKRREARAKGGANSSKAARLRKLMPSRLAPVNTMLEGVLKDLQDHKMDARTAQAIASVARALVTVFSTGEMEGRLRQLEEKEADNAA